MLQVKFRHDNAIPGGLAQLGEHLLCKQGVVGSIPSSSTNKDSKNFSSKKLLVWFFRFCQCARILDYPFNTKVALQKAPSLLIDIVRSIGCSLKIHRVESALLMETVRVTPADRAISNMKFDCVKTNVQRCRKTS